jgi:hypothetical protein
MDKHIQQGDLVNILAKIKGDTQRDRQTENKSMS